MRKIAFFFLVLFCVTVMAGEVLAGTTVKTWTIVTVKTLSEFCNEMTLKYGDVPESLEQRDNNSRPECNISLHGMPAEIVSCRRLHGRLQSGCELRNKQAVQGRRCDKSC